MANIASVRIASAQARTDDWMKRLLSELPKNATLTLRRNINWVATCLQIEREVTDARINFLQEKKNG